MTRVRVFVEGKVQGVWFRQSTQRVAQDLELAGWVRNLADGRVEALFEGPTEKVAQAVDWTRRGPERALVTGIEERTEEPVGLIGFEIRPTHSDG